MRFFLNILFLLLFLSNYSTESQEIQITETTTTEEVAFIPQNFSDREQVIHTIKYYDNNVVITDSTANSLSSAAMSLVDSTIKYDGSFYKMDYPMGDVPDSIGVCTDVIIRAYRKIEIDLQQLIHEDIVKSISENGGYRVIKPDPCIDHRRVPNIQTFMERNGTSLSTLPNPHNYLPGDIVTWKMGYYEELNHIGIVVNKKSDRYPFQYQVMHNIGGGQVIEDCLFSWTISGHYRY